MICNSKIPKGQQFWGAIGLDGEKDHSCFHLALSDALYIATEGKNEHVKHFIGQSEES